MTDHSKIFAEKILQELEEEEDGFFHIENRDGSAVLKVTKPGKTGNPVALKDVITRLHLFGVKNFDKEQIAKIVQNADGKEYEIAKWSGNPAEDCKINLELSLDNMKAFLSVTPPKNGGKNVTKERILNFLKENEIRSGIIDSAIDEIVKKQIYAQKIQIGEGTPPVNGADGYIKILFDSWNKPDLTQDEKGRIDYKNLNIIKSVERGSVLAKRIDPGHGTPGETLTGEKIPYDYGKEADWQFGANCELSGDKKELKALITGRPVLEKNGTIRVDEMVYLENVDFSTGNIDFPGTIIVEENIADGFTLRTKGSIIVKKSVGKVFFHAAGDIVLSGGFMGRNGGLIESDSDIHAKFVEQGSLIAKGSIYIDEAAMHSELSAGDSIVIQGGRGELIGGQAVAGNSIKVSKLGAVVETKTRVTIGIPPALIQELDKMKVEISNYKEVLKKVEASIKKLNDVSAKKELNEDDKDTLVKLVAVEKKYTGLLQSSNAQFEAVVSSFEPSPDAFLEAEKFIYPNVEVNLGKGKSFKSEIRTYQGRNFIAISPDGTVQLSGVQPKKIKKKI